VLDNGGGVRGQEVLDLLGKTVLAQEGTGLAATQLGDLEGAQSSGGSLNLSGN
jgi:hypothetical protein